MDIRNLIRENIRNLAPYSTARDDYQGTELSIALDANENPYDNGVNRYPDPRQKAAQGTPFADQGRPGGKHLRGQRLGRTDRFGLQGILRPKVHNAVAIAPTYSMYKVAAEINDVEVREVQLEEDFSLDADKLLAATDANTRLLWLCSPNNPTANSFPTATIERIIREFAGIVVLDEAYIDFAAEPGFLSRLGEFPNLIVLQTLSKAWGMAGLRLGLAFADPLIVATLSNVKYPYNVNGPTQQTVLERLAGSPAAQVAEILSERRRVAAALQPMKVVRKLYPSDANFVLVKVDEPRKVYDRLIAAGLSSATVRAARVRGCLRITIGTPEENTRLLEVMAQL